MRQRTDFFQTYWYLSFLVIVVSFLSITFYSSSYHVLLLRLCYVYVNLMYWSYNKKLLNVNELLLFLLFLSSVLLSISFWLKRLSRALKIAGRNNKYCWLLFKSRYFNSFLLCQSVLVYKHFNVYCSLRKADV